MPIPPALARTLAAAMLPEAEIKRLEAVHFHDAGHGYDAFGLHPAFVAMGEGICRPVYERWFRVRSYDAHHIPTSGPAILAANHSGNLPFDGGMLWADVVRHTDPPRVPRPVADHFVPALPWVGTLFARCGMVGGSRGNARSLLEAGELLMIFPEGTPGILKPASERYKLQEFRVGHVELAIRHRAPVVPVGIIGAEEQLPLLFSIKSLGKPLGISAVPVPAVPFPLPVRYHIRYGPPIRTDEEYSADQADDPAVLRKAATRVRDAVAALLEQGLRERKGVFA
jgi:1-acyl-sn-glycerol-3-phosphate acyltransferase